MKRYLKHRLIPLTLAYLGKYFMRALLWTCKVKTEGLATFLAHAEKEKCILALWHSRIPIVSEFLNRASPNFTFAAFISKSRDGEVVSLLAESYDKGKVVRVPHNDKKLALQTMIDVLKSEHIVGIMTPDGPRGPRHVAKPGVFVAAKEASAKVIPFSWSATSFWQLKSWDRMLFPKPFSTLTVSFGEPFVPKDLEQLQERMRIHEQLTCLKISANPSDWPR